MKILVTGSSGFLGASLCAHLERQECEIERLNSKNCDLRQESSLDAFSAAKYDIIFHLAAWTQAGDFCLRHPGEQWIVNQRINTNVLAWWAAQQPQAKLVFMGTSCAYAPGGNLVETDYMLGEPIESLYTYAMTKRMLYQGARALSKQFNLRYLCAVPSTLYGPGYHTDGRQMHFIFDLIRKIIRGKEYGEPVVLWGDGYQKREIVLVDDFVRLLLRLTQDVNNEILNIGAGEEFSIRTFSQQLCDIIGYEYDRIQFDEAKYVGATSKCLSIDKVKSLMKSYSLTPLRSGLQTTVQWFYSSGAFKL